MTIKDIVHKVYAKDGILYFKPYGKEEAVKSYFKNDLIKKSMETMGTVKDKFGKVVKHGDIVEIEGFGLFLADFNNPEFTKYAQDAEGQELFSMSKREEYMSVGDWLLEWSSKQYSTGTTVVVTNLIETVRLKVRLNIDGFETPNPLIPVFIVCDEKGNEVDESILKNFFVSKHNQSSKIGEPTSKPKPKPIKPKTTKETIEGLEEDIMALRTLKGRLAIISEDGNTISLSVMDEYFDQLLITAKTLHIQKVKEHNKNLYGDI